MKKLLLVLCTLLLAVPSKAVLNERGLKQQLGVLREELEGDLARQKQTFQIIEQSSARQRDKMHNYMEESNKVALMLYSQKRDYVFDLTYACNAAVEMMRTFNAHRLPYDDINTQLNQEVNRYNGLIYSLQMLPPPLIRPKGAPRGHHHALKPGDKNDDDLLLDSVSRKDRELCLKYATELRDNLIKMRTSISRDSTSYANISNVLNRVGTYAEKRFDDIKRSIFVNTGTDYFTILGKFPRYVNRAKYDLESKYDIERDMKKKAVVSEWRGPVVLGYVVFVIFYLVLSVVVSVVLVRLIWRRVKKSRYVTSCEGAFRENRIRRLDLIRPSVTLALCALVFAVSIMIVKSMLTHNFYVMASGLLVEFAWLFVAISFSLLLRLRYNQLRHGFFVYLPMLVLGLVIIIVRIMFVPNNVVNLLFPPLALGFLIWQFFAFRKNGGKLRESEIIECDDDDEEEADDEDADIDEDDDEDLAALRRKKKLNNRKLVRKQIGEIVNEESLVAQGIARLFRRRPKTNPVDVSDPQTEEDRLPRVDKANAGLSLLLMIVATILTWSGRTLMSVELVIWWLFQLTAIQTILALFRLLDLYEMSRLYERLCTDKSKIGEIAEEIRRGDHITKTWFFDLIHKALVPIVGVYSVIFSIALAAHVFNLTESCLDIFLYPFLDVEGVVRLSIFNVVVVSACYFVFRYLNYAVKAFYRHYRIRYEKQKTGKERLRTNEVNLTLGYNVISILVWGTYFIFALILLRIPKSGISLVTAGLATGIGFAMKDLLNNFFYGIQLMAGRLRVGDWIECDGVRGRVESITYQSVQILTIDNCTMSFLNSALFSNNFRNLTRNNSYEFMAFEVGVAYGTNVEKVREIVRDEMLKLQSVDKYGRKIIDTKNGHDVVVRLDSFGDNSVNLRVVAWVLVVERESFLPKAREVIYDALNRNGIEIPFPQRDVHIKTLPPEKTE